MRLTVMVFALLLAALQGGSALLVLVSDSGASVLWAIVLAAALATVVGATVMGAGPNPWGPALVAAAQLVISGLTVWVIWSEWAEARTLGVDLALAAVLGIALLASGGVAFWAVLEWGPAARQLGVLAFAGAFLLGGAGVVAATAAAQVTRVDCGRFHFDRARWDGGFTDQTRIAQTIVHCRTLIGKTRADVEGVVGRADKPGVLEISYNAAGRVSSVRLPYAD